MIRSLSITTRSLLVLAAACAMAAVFAQPVAAQTAKKLKCTGCVKSKHIKRTINLGSKSGRDGNFGVLNSARQKAVFLDGDTGNVTNLFSNAGDASNGLVKAWAMIARNGTIIECWRCNRDTNETRRTSDGTYEVDFTPLSTDISGRPRTVANDSHIDRFTTFGVVTLADALNPGANDLSSVQVLTTSFVTGDRFDVPFLLMIY